MLQDPGEAVTHVAIRRPAGSWRATTAAGSPAIASVDTAAVLERPRVSARVSGGKGAARVLRWTLEARPGQRVTFAEQGRDSANVIHRTTKARGTVRFTPSVGAARARTIVAIVEQDGTPRDTLTVARYTAPVWRLPAKPRELRVRRQGTALVVTWRGAAGAARYTVVATTSDGGREVFVRDGNQRRLRIPGVPREDRVRVDVAGLRSDDRAGPRARVVVKPVRAR